MGRRGRRPTRIVALASVGALVLFGAPAVVGGAGADGPLGPPSARAAQPAWPLDPGDPNVSAQWGADAGRTAGDGTLTLDVDAVTPQTPDAAGDLSVRVTVENTSRERVRDIVLRMQRADRLDGAYQARLAMAEPESAFEVATAFRDGFELGPGEKTTVTMSVPLGAPAPQGLGVDEAGVYPVLVNANGRPGEDITRFLAETRMLVPVTAGGDGDGDGGDDANGADGSGADRTDGADGTGTGGSDATTPDTGATPATRPTPVSLVWPLAAEVPLLPGETGEAPEDPELILTDESLATQLSPGGRLDQLLGALESALAGEDGPALRDSTCVAIEPELLETVDRMRDGYRVGDERPSPVQGSIRLRDSWGTGDHLHLRDGQGAEAAGRWLTRLEAVTDGLCVVTLPWSGAELNAVAATGDRELATEALATGDDTVSRVLDRDALPSVIIPPEGYLDAGTIPFTAYGDTRTPVDPDAAFESLQLGDGTWPPPGAQTTSLVAANSLGLPDGGIARPGDTAEIGPGAAAFGLPVPLSASLAATGAAPEVAGYTSVDGRHDLTADSGVARMQTAVGTLRQEIADAAAGAGEGTPAPIVAMPPAAWSASADDAAALLRAVASTFDDGAATPVRLGDALRESATGHSVGPARSSAPNPDPGAVAVTERQRAGQQSRYVTALATMMSNDPQVALTRNGFTRPLRRDALRALSGTGRRNARTFMDHVARGSATLDGMGTMLQQLRDSVALVTPGGVYTRATELSPVVILGRNGLPLPVPADVRVQVGDSGEPTSHPALLPAKGSLTLQITPDEPPAATDGDGRNILHMWLETAAGQRISQPVEIVVRTGPSTRTLLWAAGVLTLMVGGFALWRAGRFEGLRRIRTQWGRD